MQTSDTLKLARLQRILAAVELFALVLWVGSLFCLVAFVPWKDTAGTDGVRLSELTAQRLHHVEIIFAAVVVASNFVKMLLFGRLSQLLRPALMVSMLMLIVAFSCGNVLRPRIEEKRAELAASAIPESSGSVALDLQQEVQSLEHKYRVLLTVNMLLGFFLVYSYRVFEERKTAAIAQVLKLP